MRPVTRPPLVPLVLLLLLTGGCGGDDPAGLDPNDPNDPNDEPAELFPSQAFAEDFDAGEPGERWGCAGGGCGWEVVNAGLLDPGAETTTAGAGPGPDNFVFQSPDPLVTDPNRSGRCEAFPARFEQQGTFAFNYFVKTAGAAGPQDANQLEVAVWSHTVEFDPDFEEDVIVDSHRTVVLTASGGRSSRFHTVLPPGYYRFEFCYERNRTGVPGPDFVQIDDVETCVGTGCTGQVPMAPRCEADQGQTLVPDLSALPIPTFTLNRVQGTSNRYYVIIDTDFLDFISGGLAARGPLYDAFRAEVDGVRDVMLVDGRTCEVDHRRSLLIEMSQAEIIDLVLSTGLLTDALDALEQALLDAAVQQVIDNIVDSIRQKVLEWAVKVVAKIIVR